MPVDWGSPWMADVLSPGAPRVTDVFADPDLWYDTVQFDGNMPGGESVASTMLNATLVADISPYKDDADGIAVNVDIRESNHILTDSDFFLLS